MRLFVYLVFFWLSVFICPSSAQIQLAHFTTEQTARVGDRAVFSAQVLTPDVSYMWYFAGAEQTSRTATFETPELTLAHQGAEILCFVNDGKGNSLTLQGRLNVIAPSYQTLLLEGELRDRLGNGNMQIEMEVLLYASPEGGEPLYREHFASADDNAVVVADGRFQVRLGVKTPELMNQIRQNTDLYAEFRVGSAELREVMSPRLPITSLPYSLSTMAVMADSTRNLP